MNNKHDIKKDDFYCNDCNKKYKTYKTLWEHTKKFHKENVQLCSTNVQLCSTNVQLCSTNKSLICNLCNKIFNSRSTKSMHQKKCKNIKIDNNIIDDKLKEKELELKIKKEKNLILKQEKEILKLKLKLQKSNDVDNITLKQLNKKLLERHNLIKNLNNNSNNNSIINSNNNNVINNNVYQLVGFTKEEVTDILTLKEKKQIINAKFNCIEKLIEIIHCGNYNQFKNIIITNMNNNYIYKYNDVNGQFVLSTKSSTLNSLMDCRISDIEIIYNELVENNKLDEKTKELVEKFINKINNEDDKFTDFDGINHDNYKHYKINEVKMILYNNHDKITNDISLMLTTTDEVLEKYKSNYKIEEIDC